MRCAGPAPGGERVAGRLTGAGGREEGERSGGCVCGGGGDLSARCSVPAVRRAGEACPPPEER